MKLKRLLVLCVLILAAASSAGFILPSVFLRPKLSLNGNHAVKIPVLSSYVDSGATATADRKDISDRIQVINNVDTSKVGSYSVEYILNYKNKTYTTSRKVDVVDIESPVISLEGEEEMTLSSMDFYMEPGYSSFDKYDGDLTNEVNITRTEEDDTFTIIYTSIDSSGNSSEKKRIIHIKDITPPVITLKGSTSITINTGSKFEDYGAEAADDIDGDLSDRIITSGTVDTSMDGEYSIVYSVYDSSGNKATAERHVTVKSKGASQGSMVYLTFDDGPSSNVTPQILDTLKANGIKATFFIINFSDDNAALIKRAIAEGHTIGIHGYSHNYEKIYSSDSAFMDNVSSLKQRIMDFTGYDPFCIRFPGGSSNTVSKQYSHGIMTRLSQKVTQAGYSYYDWNVSSGDAAPNGASKDAIIKNVSKGLRKNRTNIVLMHDSESKQSTADALQEVINYIKANGYTFAPISRDTTPVHHGIAN